MCIRDSGGYNIPKHSTAREIIKLKHDGKKMVVGLITDQWPVDMINIGLPF